MTTLYRLTYISRPAFPVRAGWLQGPLAEIMAAGLRHNITKKITGLLGVERNRFFQILEGEREAVEATRARVFADSRHFDVRLIAFAPIAERAFHDWVVAFAMNGTLPPDAPRRLDFDALSADAILERGLLLRRVGVIAERGPDKPEEVA
jgi:hypothetical protein